MGQPNQDCWEEEGRSQWSASRHRGKKTCWRTGKVMSHVAIHRFTEIGYFR